MRRSVDSRRPTVSARGDKRSCGSVSQDGNSATLSSPIRSPIEAAAASASRPVAVTSSTGTPRDPPDSAKPSARVAATNGLMDDGPVTALVMEPVADRKEPKNGSANAAASRPRSAPKLTCQYSRLDCSHHKPPAAATRGCPDPAYAGQQGRGHPSPLGIDRWEEAA